jgi:ribonuclease Z
MIDRQIEQALAANDRSILQSPDLNVVLCGTGSPLPDKDRAGACTAVLAGGEFVLVDVGPGSWETVQLAGLPTGDLSAILLTHFHSDHIGDLGEAVTQSWIAGRPHPLDIYGPTGTTRVVDGFAQAYELDNHYRNVHHGEEYMPNAAAHAVGHDVALADTRMPTRWSSTATVCASPCSACTTIPSCRRSATASTIAAGRS